MLMDELYCFQEASSGEYQVRRTRNRTGSTWPELLPPRYCGQSESMPETLS